MDLVNPLLAESMIRRAIDLNDLIADISSQSCEHAPAGGTDKIQGSRAFIHAADPCRKVNTLASSSAMHSKSLSAALNDGSGLTRRQKVAADAFRRTAAADPMSRLKNFANDQHSIHFGDLFAPPVDGKEAARRGGSRPNSKIIIRQ